MANNYIFSLQPTFTQGLIIGQLSILCLLFFILKYLFLDSTEYPFETSSYHPRVASDLSLRHTKGPSFGIDADIPAKEGTESAEWFHALLHQIFATYRSKLRNDRPSAEGDKIACKKIEDFANFIRPAGFLDHIEVHSVDLGGSAPRISNARTRRRDDSEIEVDVDYTDSISISLSTSYLFNYPMSSFARLPVSLTISLSLFKSLITITPPSPTSPTPVLTITIAPDFLLDLSTSSLMGSRAKLANVPKLHEMIQHQVRRVLAAKGTWKVALPGLTTAAEVIEEMELKKKEL